MEGNKEEAKRCLDIAYKYFCARKLSRARKFALKSKQLYPSVQCQKLLDEINSKKDPPSQDEEKYTQDQLDLVERIKKCRNSYYEILGVPKNATTIEIQKTYKKIALRLHPDKNRAPGATEAFKIIGNAMAVLTDAAKRKAYDLSWNEDPPFETFFQDSHDTESEGSEEMPDDSRNNSNYFFARMTKQEILILRLKLFVEKILNHRFRFILDILIWILLMEYLTLLYSSYKLEPSIVHTVERRTSGLGVTYYVKQNFEKEHFADLAKVEKSVEEEYLYEMKKFCQRTGMSLAKILRSLGCFILYLAEFIPKDTSLQDIFHHVASNLVGNIY